MTLWTIGSCWQRWKRLASTTKNLNILASYLKDRRQYVVVDSFPFQLLAVVPNSVTQGLSLSCIMYIIMIMDITSIYHSETYSPSESMKCQQNNGYPDCENTAARTFVDDNILITKTKNWSSIQQAVSQTIDRLEQYTNANLLALNPREVPHNDPVQQQANKKSFPNHSQWEGSVPWTSSHNTGEYHDGRFDMGPTREQNRHTWLIQPSQDTPPCLIFHEPSIKKILLKCNFLLQTKLCYQRLGRGKENFEEQSSKYSG